MSMPVRIQRKRSKGWQMPPNTVYVGRPTKWGNPFTVGVDGDASECVAKYAELWMPYTHKDGDLEKFLISDANLSEIIAELKGKNLACWCKEGQPCHADFLLSIANHWERN